MGQAIAGPSCRCVGKRQGKIFGDMPGGDFIPAGQLDVTAKLAFAFKHIERVRQ